MCGTMESPEEQAYKTTLYEFVLLLLASLEPNVTIGKRGYVRDHGVQYYQALAFYRDQFHSSRVMP